MAKSSENWLMGIVIALGFFFIILVLGIVLKGVIQSSQASDGATADNAAVKGDYSLQQAYSVCKAKIESMEYLQAQFIRLDDKSSRFDEESKQFFIFIDLDVMRDGKSIDEFARCYVSSVDNSIIEFRLKGNRSLFGQKK